MKTLLFLTATFPAGGITESAFILPEIEPLAARFDRIVIMPYNAEDSTINLTYGNIEVDLSFAKSNKRIRHIWQYYRCFRSLLNDRFRQSIINDDVLCHPRSLLTSMRFYYEARLLSRCIRQSGLIDEPGLTIYSFWFNEAALGASLASENLSIPFVCRGHGYDIYDYRVKFRSNYFNRFSLSQMRQLMVVSEHGTKYLQNNYPEYSDKIKKRYLGSHKSPEEYNMLTRYSEGKYIRILTCARCSPVKRVRLTYKLILGLANTFKSYGFEWVYIGDGEDFQCLQHETSKNPCPNLTISLRGALSNNAIHRLYQTENIDWSILTSESEGLPITICESLSYGVPVIATAVGGVPEIVDASVGILLSNNPTETELNDKISPFIENKSKFLTLRQNAFKKWQSQFAADTLREDFAEFIANLQ